MPDIMQWWEVLENKSFWKLNWNLLKTETPTFTNLVKWTQSGPCSQFLLLWGVKLYINVGIPKLKPISSSIPFQLKHLIYFSFNLVETPSLWGLVTTHRVPSNTRRYTSNSSSIIDEYQHMYLFTFNTVLVYNVDFKLT